MDAASGARIDAGSGTTSDAAGNRSDAGGTTGVAIETDGPFPNPDSISVDDDCQPGSGLSRWQVLFGCQGQSDCRAYVQVQAPLANTPMYADTDWPLNVCASGASPITPDSPTQFSYDATFTPYEMRYVSFDVPSGSPVTFYILKDGKPATISYDQPGITVQSTAAPLTLIPGP
jgi:hypothetical protein